MVAASGATPELTTLAVDGVVALESRSQLNVNNLFIHSGGSLLLRGGTVTAVRTVAAEDARIEGFGTLAASVRLTQGVIAPLGRATATAGTLHVRGYHTVAFGDVDVDARRAPAVGAAIRTHPVPSASARERHSVGPPAVVDRGLPSSSSTSRPNRSGAGARQPRKRAALSEFTATNPMLEIAVVEDGDNSGLPNSLLSVGGGCVRRCRLAVKGRAVQTACACVCACAAAVYV